MRCERSSASPVISWHETRRVIPSHAERFRKRTRNRRNKKWAKKRVYLLVSSRLFSKSGLSE
jgi:hypothetical protein